MYHQICAFVFVSFISLSFNGFAAPPLLPSEIGTIEATCKQAKMENPSPCPKTLKCTEANDQFCDQLWADPNRGNLPKSNLYFGKSAKSELSMAEQMDTQALLAARHSFPEDLKKEAATILDDLQTTMNEERDDKSWYKRRNRLLEDFWDAAAKVAKNRAASDHPELKTVPEKDRTYEQRAWIKRSFVDLDVLVTRAKYAEAPNWKRVQKTFAEARSDLLQEIEHLKFPPETRKLMRAKLESVQLQLPEGDPGAIYQMKNCDTTEENAFYSPGFNKITLCAGYFNNVQSESLLYATIAHELGHSIDPRGLASDKSDRSGIAKTLQPFCHAKGPVMSCDEWRKFKGDHLQRPKSIRIPEHPLLPLSDCLKPTRNGFAPFSTQTIQEISEQLVEEDMNSYATSHAFTRIASPFSEKKNGRDIPNDYYFRPDRLESNGLESAPKNRCLGYVDLPIFAQILECNHYRQADKNTRAGAFRSAIEEFKTVKLAITDKRLADCGRECGDNIMQYKQLSRPTGEEVADWLSKKVMTKKIAREPSISKRLQMVNENTADLCTRPGAFSDANDLLRAEKEASTEPHPENSQRRHAFFTPDIAKLLGCEISKAKGTPSACDFSNKEK